MITLVKTLLMNVEMAAYITGTKQTHCPQEALILRLLVGSTNAPTVAKQVLVSDRDRHIIAFGCDTEANPGVQDPLAIRFSSPKNL